MDQNISEYSPSNTQALLRMVEALVAGYRNGGNVYVGVDEISAEWERQNLPCRIKDHVCRHNLHRQDDALTDYRAGRDAIFVQAILICCFSRLSPHRYAIPKHERYTSSTVIATATSTKS
jgi:hypothetical protein